MEDEVANRPPDEAAQRPAEEEAAQRPAEEKPAHHTAGEGAKRRGILSDNRVKIALGIATAEGLIAAVNTDFTKVTIIAIAIPVLLFHILAGRNLESNLGRDISWTLALSQAFAAIAGVVAFFIDTLVLILAGAFAAVALILIWTDRPTARSK